MIENPPLTPKNAFLEEAVEFETSIGCSHACVIASSPFGMNNDHVLDVLERMKGKWRGIGYIDPVTTTDAELDRLHAAGMRGIRFNLWVRQAQLDPAAWPTTLEAYAKRLRRLDWVMQVFVSMDQIKALAPYVAGLGVKVVFDHLGCPEPGPAPAEQPGCQELYDLLQNNKNVYIKLSGFYRFDRTDQAGLKAHMQKLLAIAPDQIVWASDWPHTVNPGGDPKVEYDFMKVDVGGFLDQCVEWCNGDEELIKKVWVDNPRKLWDYPFDD